MPRKFRARRLNEVIKEELGKIIFENFDVESDVLLTVTRTAISDDFVRAVVWVSIFPLDRAVSLFKKLENSAGFLQHLLDQRLDLHPAPRIHFKLEINLEN